LLAAHHSWILCVVVALLGCRGRAPQPQRRVTTLEVGAPSDAKRLLRGFTAGNEALRWTNRVFAVALDRPEMTGTPTFLEMDFSIPQELIKDTGSVTLTVRANGVEACRRSYREATRHLLSCQVPEKGLERLPAEIEVEADRSYRDAGAREDRALIVLSMALKEYEATAEFEKTQAAKPREAFARVAEHWKGLPPDQLREMTGLFYRVPVYMNTWYQGIPIAKVPLDLWIMQQIIYETKPDFIIETGTWQGGSALYFASVLHNLARGGRVLSVDIEDMHRPAETHSLWKQYVDFFLGSSTDQEIVKTIRERVKNRRVLVTLDSDHSLLHVLRELKLYGPLVSKGSYLIVEDTHMDGVPTLADYTTGPLAAVERFLETGGNKDFDVDYSREMFMVSFNPGGWLRRK
jgi:cephalosporin hydroxylase